MQSIDSIDNVVDFYLDKGQCFLSESQSLLEGTTDVLYLCDKKYAYFSHTFPHFLMMHFIILNINNKI